MLIAEAHEEAGGSGCPRASRGGCLIVERHPLDAKLLSRADMMLSGVATPGPRSLGPHAAVRMQGAFSAPRRARMSAPVRVRVPF
jgi:hypothetical protein